MELQYGIDYSYWYEVEKAKLHPDIQTKFKIHHYDKDTEEFVQDACNISYFKHVFDNTASIFLLPFVSATSRNAILNRGVMFVASSELFKEMLDGCPRRDSVLDIGAGDGNVTRRFADSFANVYATETSPPMRNRLQARGYNVMEISNWHERAYDAITCLNVLDRCHEPYKLLQDMYNSVKTNGGTVIIALVLPYHGSVEGGQSWARQKEPLKIKGISYEEQLSSFILDILEPMGFELNLATKVPYLCTGDIQAKYYSLADSLVSLNVKPEQASESIM